MSEVDKLRRAFSTLTSLKQNVLEEGHHLHERYVTEYHRVVDGLEKQGMDLTEFKIPQSELKPILASYNGLSGESTYSDDNYVQKTFFLMKLDALLGYFSLTIDDKKPHIGFK